MVSEKQIEAAAKAIYANAKNTDARDIARIALTAAEQAESATAEPVAYKVVRKKFYVSEWGSSKLLEARDGGLVTDEGEAWLYEYTSKDGTGGSYDMLFRRVYTHPIPSEPAPAAEPFESCPDCAGSGYSNHPDSGQVCYRCNGQGSYTNPTPSEARLREALENIVSIGQIAIGNATINRMVSIARAALKEASDERS